MTDFAIPMSDGHWISAEVARTVERIQEYDPNLSVKWIPPDVRDPGDSAFVIMHRTPDGDEYPAFYVDSEENFNFDVFLRVYLADTSIHDVWHRMEADNEVEKRVREQREWEARQADNDLVKHIIRSPLHKYKAEGVTYSEYG